MKRQFATISASKSKILLPISDLFPEAIAVARLGCSLVPTISVLTSGDDFYKANTSNMCSQCELAHPRMAGHSDATSTSG